MVKEMCYQENTLFDLDPKVKGVMVTQNAQYPRHHVTYAPAKFEAATSHVTCNTLFDLDLEVNVTQNVGQYP